jgi:hypothetical protein
MTFSRPALSWRSFFFRIEFCHPPPFTGRRTGARAQNVRDEWPTLGWLAAAATPRTNPPAHGTPLKIGLALSGALENPRG